MASRTARIFLSASLMLVVAGCQPAAEEGESAPGVVPAPGAASAEPYEIVGGDIVLLPRRDLPRQGFGVGLNGRHVLFLNTEGVDVRAGGSNAMENSGIRDRAKNDAGVIEVEAYAPSAATRFKDILQIHKLVSGWYADFNVDVVISRPLSGDYMMTVVGGGKGDLGYGGGIVGISPGDCKNQNDVDLNYAFSASLGHNVQQTATTAAHEAGHAYGLGHSQNNRDIMYPSVVPQTDGFASGLAADPGPCGLKMGDVQDGAAVLTENLGARDPASQRPGEGTGPQVSFLSPADLGDAAVSVGADLTIAVKAEARLGIDRVVVLASVFDGSKARGGHPLFELRPPLSSGKVKFSAAGDYLLIAAAYDRAGNLALAQGRLKVATPTCSLPNDCAPGQRCVGNVCTTAPLPPKGEGGEAAEATLRPWGTACGRTSECVGGICALTPVGQICTHYCNPDRFCAIPGLECVDGICLPPIIQRTAPKVGQFGGKCTRNQDCGTGECSAASMEDPTAPRYCTKVCEPDVAWSCPTQMSCIMTDGASGMKNRCVAGVKAAPSGGCDATGGGATPLGMLLSLLFFLFRPRRSSAARA